MRDILTDLNSMLSHPDPVRRAQIQMKKPMPKRFYKDVSVVETPEGFAIHLDGKVLKTPARMTLALPNKALAELVAAEWDAQLTEINPNVMPVTKLVNTALDAIAKEPRPVHDDIVSYAGTDLICYRADAPDALVARQAEAWDPLLDWVKSEFGACFILAEGIIHQAQPQSALQAFSTALERFSSPLALASLHVVTTLGGSAILALAFGYGHLTADQCWNLAHVDEDWNIEHWGQDDEAIHRRKLRRIEFDAATKVFASLG